jgi:hypothetical protein
LALVSPTARAKLWPRLRYEPHEGQCLIHASSARHRVAVEGRRAGKSQTGGHELSVEAIATKPFATTLLEAGLRREFWIIGPEYSDSEKEFRVLWNDAKRLGLPLDRPGSYNNPEGGPMTVSLWDGAFIVHAKSAKYPGTLVGESLDGVIMAEAAKLKKIVWTQFARPMLADTKGWSLWLTTPEGRNWVYELWQLGQNSRVKAWESWRFGSWINSFVFPGGATEAGIKMLKATRAAHQPLTPEIIAASGVDEEIVAMFEEMSLELFAQEVEAKFTEFVGAVFKAFDESYHVRPLEYNPALPVFAAIDYGWTNPFVVLLLQVDSFGNVYVLHENYETERDTSEVAEDLSNRWPLLSKVRVIYPDPAEPDDTHTLKKKWRVRAATNTGGELKTRLELIRNALKPALVGAYPVTAHNIPIVGAPRLLVDSSCTNLIGEMQAYRYPETKEESLRNPNDEPMDKDNHGPEALGRFYKGYFGKIERPTGATVRGSGLSKTTVRRRKRVA